MRYCASRPSPAVDAKAMSVDIHRVAAASGSEGLTLMLEEFWVGRPKERDEISYEFPRRPAILCIFLQSATEISFTQVMSRIICSEPRF